MKKELLFCLALCGALSADAQNRLALFEEFTGEHCVPCAVANPGLQNLLGLNSKVLHITYSSPFPAGGPIYNTYKAIVNSRIAYYGIAAAPQGRLNGIMMGSGTSSPTTGHVNNFTQADLNAAGAAAAPYTLNVAHSWSATGDSVTAVITIKTPNAYTAPVGANLKLRLALVEHLHYGAPPGINGEQDFPNVVRDMFPSPAGISLQSAWATGETVTLYVTNAMGRYIDKNNANMIAWIQNDADKNISQAAISTPVPISLDVATLGVQPASRLQCVPGNASATAYALLRNGGTSTLTSARVYYRTDVSTAMTFVNWTGSLAPNGVTLVSLGAMTIPGGNHFISDSVALPNGSADINGGNNTGKGNVSIYNTTPVNLPIVTGFETATGTIPAGWILYDADSNGRNFTVSKNLFGGAAGYGGSTWFLQHNNFYVPSGEVNYAILPAAKLVGGTMLSFAYAHAQYAAENDKLEVAYSTDCGASWTSVWSAAGATLSTAPPTTDYFIPTATQWSSQSVDVGGIPPTAMLALKATSDYGNTLYIDNVRLEVPASVSEVENVSAVSVFPSPARTSAQLRFRLSKTAELNIRLTDATGRMVTDVAMRDFEAGTQQLQIETAGLAAGLYYLSINGSGINVTKPLNVLK